MSVKEMWIQHCLELGQFEPSPHLCFQAGNRKIVRHVKLDFPRPFENFDITLSDVGFTRAKMSQLSRNYLFPESIEAAQTLWNRYRSRPKYNSVSFSTYKTFIKDHGGTHGSKIGPCMQSVVITLLNKREAEITVLYRSTELFKKFLADLIFLKDFLLPGFDFSGMNITNLSCQFVNVSVASPYFATIIPHLEDPIQELEVIRNRDTKFYRNVMNWNSVYFLPERSYTIAKFEQLKRVSMDVNRRLVSRRIKAQLVGYLREWSDNNPRGRGSHSPQIEEENEE